jgi:hypothetical protein
MTSDQRIWLLRNPALQEGLRKKRVDVRWTVLVWWIRLKCTIRCALDPLPTPCLSKLPTLLSRLPLLAFILPKRGSDHYMSLLNWVKYLAQNRPDLVRDFLSRIAVSDYGIWSADVVSILAEVGRVGLVIERIQIFMKRSTTILQKVKLWEWLSNERFANPHIAKTLIRLAVRILQFVEDKKQRSRMRVDLLSSRVVLSTLSDVAPWLSRRVPEDNLLNLCLNRRHPTLAAAMRNTTLGHRILQTARFQAVVRIAQFFNNHVRLQKVKTVCRNDCAICWNPKILWSLHGEHRHGVCSRCLKQLRKNGIVACPVCRAQI